MDWSRKLKEKFFLAKKGIVKEAHTLQQNKIAIIIITRLSRFV